MSDKTLAIKLSPSAKQALTQRESPLIVEIELYFSCLIRKRVLFPDSARNDGIALPSSVDNLQVIFHPVMSRKCSVSETQGAPDLETFPIAKPEAFIPRWLKLDRVNNQWQGEYGFD
jgi:hypothetical protein